MESTKQSIDCINRAEVCRLCNNKKEYCGKEKCPVYKASTVDAKEVVHAKWENVQNGKGCCSSCHRLDGIDPLATHCRYCGAKMDLE